MNLKAFFILCILLSLSIFNSCLPDCGDHPEFFTLSSINLVALEFSGDLPTIIEGGSFAADKILLDVYTGQVDYVAQTPALKSPENGIQFFGFGGSAYACSVEAAKSKHKLTSIEVFPTEAIEFDVALTAGQDISSYLSIDYFGIDGETNSSIADFLDNELDYYEGTVFQLLIEESLGAPYNGQFRVKLGFADGHSVEATTQELSIF